MKGDSSIAVSLAQKKDKNIIKDLRQTLKTETMKCQQFRAEYLQLQDEKLFKTTKIGTNSNSK